MASQGQTLTASVSDIDGLPASVSYLWQSSDNGSTWSDVASGQSLTLGSSLVGKRVRVNATYTDLLSTGETCAGDRRLQFLGARRQQFQRLGLRPPWASSWMR